MLFGEVEDELMAREEHGDKKELKKPWEFMCIMITVETEKCWREEKLSRQTLEKCIQYFQKECQGR